MASKNSSSPELATSAIERLWDENKKVVCLFNETSYTMTDFLSLFDTLRLDSDPRKSRASAKASRLFYTFSGLHFLLKQVYNVSIRGLNHSPSIETMKEVTRHFENGNNYFTEFIKILKIVEIHYLELIVFEEENSLATDYLGEVLINEQMTALEKKVRGDQLTIPYLLMVLEYEGLDISVALIRDMFHIS